MNELITEKSWWKRNWKWITPIAVLCIGTTIILSVISSLGIRDNLIGFGEVLSDSTIYDNALEKAKKNKRVIEVMGELEPISSWAIIEGDVGYQNNKNTIKMSIRVIGNKATGSMDIEADRHDNTWKYNIINIRIKNPPERKETISIVNSGK